MSTIDDDFDELTTDDVKALARAEEEEVARATDVRRRTGRDVEQPARAQRSHVTPAQADKAARAPRREHSVAWRPAANLDAPPAPAGYVLRWIRFQQGDRDDPKNLSRKLREGWEPYLVSDAPDGYIPPDSTNVRQLGSVISVGDLLLCKMPRERWVQRQAFYARKREQQSKAVRNKFRAAEDPSNPFQAEYRQSASGGGRRPIVQADE